MGTLDSLVNLARDMPEGKADRRSFLKFIGGTIGAGMVSNNDTMLESRMGSFIQEKRKSGYLNPADEISVTVYDIDNNRKVVSINEDARRMAASTIKDYVMLAVFHQINRKKIKYSRRIQRLLERMIRESHNPSTNSLIRELGGVKNVSGIIRSDFPYFNETMVVETIPDDGRTYKNTTSSHDLNIFYNQLWKGNLPYAQEMKRILRLPKKDRLTDRTCIPSNTIVYNKTGTVHGLVADSGILVMRDNKGNQYPYAISVMIEDKTRPHSGDSRAVRDTWKKRRSELIRDISEGTYDFLYNLHMEKPYRCKEHGGMHLGRRQ